MGVYRPYRYGIPIYHHGVFIKNGFYHEFTSKRKYNKSIDRIMADKQRWEGSATLEVSGEDASPMWLRITTTDDDLVIDFDDTGMNLLTYANFKNGCNIYMIDHNDAFAADEICERAVDNFLFFSDAYDLLGRNCEMLANFIVCGKKKSHQTKRFLCVVIPPLAWWWFK